MPRRRLGHTRKKACWAHNKPTKPATVVNNAARNEESEFISPFTVSEETTTEMEEQNDAVSRGAGGESSLFDGSAHWWWAMGSGAQIMWGVRCIRRGYAGDLRFTPVKAFGIASLFVGAIATTSVAFLSASGIHTVSPMLNHLISFISLVIVPN